MMSRRASSPSSNVAAAVAALVLVACGSADDEASSRLSAVSSVPAHFFAISSDQTYLYWQTEDWTKQGKNLRGLGLGMIRVQLCDWPAQKGAMDQMINAFRAQGLKIYAEINYCTVKLPKSSWHEGFVDSGAGNAYAKAFAKAAGEMATHFKGRVAYWEIWNEPDSPPNGGPQNPDWDGACGAYSYGPSWGWGLCPKQLGVITANSYEKIRAADPNARVVAGNVLFHGDDNWVGREYWRAVYQSQRVQSYKNAHGKYPWDVVGIHPYNWEADQPAMVEVLDDFENVLDSRGDPSALAITEYGIDAGSTATAQRQADLVALTYELARQRQYEFVVWFNYRDDDNAKLYMGIRRPNGSWKPAADVFCQITSQSTCTTGNPVVKPPSLPSGVAKDASGIHYPAIGACWTKNGAQPAAGLPHDNGGGKPVHVWGPGKVQDFAGGYLGANICMQKNGWGTAYMVRGGIRNAYFNAGGGEGALGYPKNDEYGSATGPRQDFEHGYITWDHSLVAFRAYYQ
jgi:hypothetical protein